MKVLGLAFAIFCLSAFSYQSANACSVAPIERTPQVNLLAAQALNAINVSIERMIQIQVSDYQAQYIWTPMCPEGETSQARFVIYYRHSNPLIRACSAVINVSSKLMYDSAPRDYSIKVVQDSICIESI